MHTFTGRVKTFNGKYWTTTHAKVKASNWSQAMSAAIRQTLRIQPARTRNEQIHVELVRVPQVKVKVPKLDTSRLDTTSVAVDTTTKWEDTGI